MLFPRRAQWRFWSAKTVIALLIALLSLRSVLVSRNQIAQTSEIKGAVATTSEATTQKNDAAARNRTKDSTHSTQNATHEAAGNSTESHVGIGSAAKTAALLVAPHAVANTTQPTSGGNSTPSHNQSHAIRRPEINALGMPVLAVSLPDNNNSEITKPTQSNELAPKHPTDIVPLGMQQSSPHRVPHQLVFKGKDNTLNGTSSQLEDHAARAKAVTPPVAANITHHNRTATPKTSGNNSTLSLVNHVTTAKRDGGNAALKPTKHSIQNVTETRDADAAAHGLSTSPEMNTSKEAGLGMTLVETSPNTTNHSHAIRKPEINTSGIPIALDSLPDRNDSESIKPTERKELTPKHPTDIVPLEMQQSSPHRVPHQLVFTGRDNILELKQPKVVYDNLLNTIAAYRSFWNEPDAPVWFLDNADCERVIGYTNQTLLEIFRNETHGPFKSDICRAVALYLVGGYYFDNDIAIMTRPYVPPINETSFVTVQMSDERFVCQCLMISEREAPVLRTTFDTIVVYYNNKPYKDGLVRGWMGPWTVKQAVDQVRQNTNTSENEIVLMTEMHLDKWTDPNRTLPRQESQRKGRLCNYVIGQPNTNSSDPRVFDAYFWTRAVGINPKCT